MRGGDGDALDSILSVSRYPMAKQRRQHSIQFSEQMSEFLCKINCWAEPRTICFALNNVIKRWLFYANRENSILVFDDAVS